MLRILFLFLILFQIAGAGYLNNAFTRNTEKTPGSQDHAAALLAAHEAPDISETEGMLYSPESLLLPDVVLSPIPTFQFGFISVLACFLFVIFSINACKQVKEKPSYVTHSYYHTLFLSAILIHAP